VIAAAESRGSKAFQSDAAALLRRFLHDVDGATTIEYVR
jgi:hypothetical protein